MTTINEAVQRIAVVGDSRYKHVAHRHLHLLDKETLTVAVEELRQAANYIEKTILPSKETPLSIIISMLIWDDKYVGLTNREQEYLQMMVNQATQADLDRAEELVKEMGEPV